MNRNYQHTIPIGVTDIRFLDYVLKSMPHFFTRNGAKKAIKNGSLLLNGQRVESGRHVLPEQVITFCENEKAPARPFELPLEVIFEDDCLALVKKPAGYSVSGNYFRTIENALPFNLQKPESNDALQKPQTVHRLDNQTSGLLLVAKTHKACIELGRQFEERRILKRYQAIVIGEVLENGILDTPIDGKEAITHFKTLQSINSVKYGFLSLVELAPLTGRTHQLRIHLAGIGHPILGDKLYTDQHPLLTQKGLFLCATYLEFEHPVSGQKFLFEIKLPPKFYALLERERKQYLRLYQSNIQK